MADEGIFANQKCSHHNQAEIKIPTGNILFVQSISPLRFVILKKQADILANMLIWCVAES